MHDIQRPVTVGDFARLKYFLAQTRETKKRRAQLYGRILSVVEEKIGLEVLINKDTIARVIGVDAVQVGNIINTHQALSRVICKHQRKHGNTLAQRRKIQGPFVPSNP